MKFILIKNKKMSDCFKGLFIRSYDREGREAFDKRIKINNKIYYMTEVQEKLYYNIYEIKFRFIEL